MHSWSPEQQVLLWSRVVPEATPATRHSLAIEAVRGSPRQEPKGRSEVEASISFLLSPLAGLRIMLNYLSLLYVTQSQDVCKETNLFCYLDIPFVTS